jgi:SH3-like domain-containing protein
MMKKILFFTLLFVTALAAGAQNTVTAFIWDNDLTTNIRNSPKGKVVMTVSADEPYVFELSTPRNGWWRIETFYNAANYDEDTSLEGSSTGEYWIHYSVIAVSSRNYGGEDIYLRDAPDEDANIVAVFNEEVIFKPLDVVGDWVKVKLDNTEIVGWIEKEWLCDNPLTTCS